MNIFFTVDLIILNNQKFTKDINLEFGVNILIKMTIRIVIAGESQCEIFAQVCVIADYLSQNLPDFCYEAIEKPVVEWQVKHCFNCNILN